MQTGLRFSSSQLSEIAAIAGIFNGNRPENP
jgi:hypothetical protein